MIHVNTTTTTTSAYRAVRATLANDHDGILARYLERDRAAQAAAYGASFAGTVEEEATGVVIRFVDVTPRTYDQWLAHYGRRYGTGRLGRWLARRDAVAMSH